MNSSSNTITPLYKISPNLIKGLKGVLSTNEMPIGTLVKVDNTTFRVVKSRQIVIKYNVESRVPTIHDGIEFIMGTQNCCTFLKQVGIFTIFDLFKVVFNGINPEDYDKGVRYFFNQFLEYNEMIFKK